MQLSGSSRLGGPAVLIAGLTCLMLGAMTFALPPSRIAVEASGAERGALVSHAGFSATLAGNIAADGYNYLCIDLTTAATGEGGHWKRYLERVNAVQFPVWAWIELKSEWEVEAVRQAQVATIEHAAIAAKLEARVIEAMAEATIKGLLEKTQGLKPEDAKKQAEAEIAAYRKRMEAQEQAARTRAAAAAEAARHASAEWKLTKVVPGLNLRGLYIAGPGAVERVALFQAANPGLRVLPVIRFGEDAPDIPHAVLMTREEFAANAAKVEHPILRAAQLDLAAIEEVRKATEGGYLVARVSVVR